MEIAVKYICAKSYDFTDKNGQRVKGITCYCYEPKTDIIIKVKVRHENVIRDKSFGDNISVMAVPNGRYINYEV